MLRHNFPLCSLLFETFWPFGLEVHVFPLTLQKKHWFEHTPYCRVNFCFLHQEINGKFSIRFEFWVINFWNATWRRLAEKRKCLGNFPKISIVPTNLQLLPSRHLIIVFRETFIKLFFVGSGSNLKKICGISLVQRRPTTKVYKNPWWWK